MRIVDGEPIWEDGDVVYIAFRRKDGTTNGKEYVYTRTDGWWPGEQRGQWSSHDDSTMSRAWHDGDVAVLTMTAATQAGQVQMVDWDVTRLRIAERALRNVSEIIETTSLDRPLSSFIDEIRAVLP